MTTLSTPERLRKTICGSCLIAGPALLLFGGLLHPKETSNAARQYEIVADNADRWELAHWLITASMLLMVGAVLGLAHLLHEERPAEAILGGAVALVGVLALFAVAAAETVVIPELGRSSENGAPALYERIFEFGSTRWTVLLVAVLLLPVGLVAMSYGLYRAQLAAPWAVGALGFGAVLFAVALPTGSAVVFAVGLAALFIGMAAIGWEMLGETDEQWQHPRRRNATGAT
jgi:MFS family permease